MAEFQEIIKQFRRMCWYYQRQVKCDGCPMAGCNISQCRKLAFDRPDDTKIIVTKWAAEHPVVYPTWGEWLEQQGICFSRLTNYSRVGGVSIPQVFNYQIEGKTAFICGDKVNEPISADIAQKLGIEPKEDA